MTVIGERRPRGTPEKAREDIMAAMARLAKARPEDVDRLTATSLAQEAGMSRKQLYNYFAEFPALSSAWHELRGRQRGPAVEPSVAVDQRMRALEQALEAWKSVAAIARAEAERQAQVNELLRAENERLRQAREATAGQVVPLRPS